MYYDPLNNNVNFVSDELSYAEPRKSRFIVYIPS